MKVIDLLNKIANGENLPEKIRYDGKIWKLNKLNETYDNGECCLFEDYIDKKYVITDILNDEVEIIEEDKKIEKLTHLNNVSNASDLVAISQMQWENNSIIERKINEIIDILNKEK